MIPDIYWAAWNDCNGVFADTMRWSRAEAVDAANEQGILDGTSGTIIMPFRIKLAPKREWDDLERMARFDDKQWGRAPEPIDAPLSERYKAATALRFEPA